jgi:hypothetical protein
LAAGGAEGGDGHRDGQLEVVAGGGERERGGALVVQANSLTQSKGASPHDRKVGQQRQRDAGDIQGVVGHLTALQGEEDHDGEQQPVERHRPDVG